MRIVPRPVTSPVYSGNVEADADVALRAEVIDLIRADAVDQAGEIQRVAKSP